MFPKQIRTNSAMPAAQNKNEDLSFSIVWSPLPLITWICPVIGHLGITDSRGVASDFRGPYFVGDDGRMAFGAPTRALRINANEIGAERWDGAILEANDVYRGRMHNICCDNCHSHVACALNRMPLTTAFGIHKWNMIKLALLVFFRGKFLSWTGVLTQFGPFGVLVLVVVLSTALRK